MTLPDNVQCGAWVLVKIEDKVIPARFIQSWSDGSGLRPLVEVMVYQAISAGPISYTIDISAASVDLLPCDMCEYAVGDIICCSHSLATHAGDVCEGELTAWVLHHQGGACYLAKPKEVGK